MPPNFELKTPFDTPDFYELCKGALWQSLDNTIELKNTVMDYGSLAKRIIHLKKTDLEIRDELVQAGKIGEGYHPEMERVHNRNARILNEIIEKIGYPTVDKVGKEASEAAWLIIQHSIGQPDFMKKCRDLLEKAVHDNRANPINLAYLTDRIQVYEGKPQRYGTQFRWDEKGELSPYPVDDGSKVNKRRESLGLNTIEEQTVLMRQQAKNENQSPPKDFEKRKREMQEWRKKMGWSK